MTILVTGSTGFVGWSVMRALARQGTPARPYEGRINDPYALRRQLDGVEGVIHLASAHSRGRARSLQHVDVEGTARVVEESRAASVKRIVLLSRLGAEPSSLFPLLRAKGEQEALVRRGGVPYTIVRSATLFGRRDRYLNHIAGLAAWSRPFVWLPGGGRAVVQPLWVEDLVRCLLLAQERPELADQTVSVAGEERLRYAELARVVLDSAGMSPVIPLNVPILLVRMLSAPLFAWWPRPPVTRFWLDSFSAPDIAPLDAVRYHFGFQPAALRGHIAYLRRPGLRRRLLGLTREGAASDANAPVGGSPI